MKATSLAILTVLAAASLALHLAPRAEGAPSTPDGLSVEVTRREFARSLIELQDPLLTDVRRAVRDFYLSSGPDATPANLAAWLGNRFDDVTLNPDDPVRYYWAWDETAGEWILLCKDSGAITVGPSGDPNPIVISFEVEVG